MTRRLATAEVSGDASAYQRLRERLQSGLWSACLRGLGHVGQPLVASIADAGIPVVGVDTDPRVVEALRSGDGLGDGEFLLSSHLSDGGVRVGMLDEHDIDADVVFICVPTPLDAAGEPDLTSVQQAAEQAAERGRPGQLIALESTVYPGATRAIVGSAFDRAGLRPGVDVFIAHAPSRINPGDVEHPLREIPRVVGGLDERSAELARLAYSHFTHDVVVVASAEVAEMSKLLENTARAVNIALANEMAMLCHDLGVNIWEVVDAAATKPFGFLAHQPGPGVGGHCIPVDPAYLKLLALREGSPHTSLLSQASAINRQMPEYVVDRLAASLQERGTKLSHARVLLAGIGYKRDADDLRDAPAIALIERLQATGATVDYHDPLIPRLVDEDLSSVELTAESLRRYEAVVLVTDHSTLDYALMATHAPMILDTRNAFATRSLSGPHIEVL